MSFELTQERFELFIEPLIEKAIEKKDFNLASFIAEGVLDSVGVIDYSVRLTLLTVVAMAGTIQTIQLDKKLTVLTARHQVTAEESAQIKETIQKIAAAERATNG